ncbi:MAG: hypothetical protein V8Q84_10555 [Bilophila sp.]
MIPSFRSEMAETLDFPKGSTTVLLKTYRSRKALLDRLERGTVEILYGERLAMDRQILLSNPGDIRQRPIPFAHHGQEAMKRRPSPPPWTRPGRLLWLALALAASGWLILHMPASRTARPAASPTGTQAPATEAPSRHIPAASHAVTEAPGHALLPDSGAGSHAATSPAAPQTPRAQVPAASTDAPASPRSEAARQAVTEAPTPPAEAPRRMKQAPLSPGGKLLAKAETFGRLFALVGIAAFLGGLMEARRWHMALARVMGKLTRMARLPEIVGLAMPTALCSNAAANSMLVSSHAEGHIRTSALIAGGMANSYLAYVSHSIRVMYPVIGPSGCPARSISGCSFWGAFWSSAACCCGIAGTFRATPLPSPRPKRCPPYRRTPCPGPGPRSWPPCAPAPCFSAWPASPSR